jgi:hypothetical protein
MSDLLQKWKLHCEEYLLYAVSNNYIWGDFSQRLMGFYFTTLRA